MEHLERPLSPEEKQSRAMFRAYLANEASALFLKRELEKSNTDTPA